MMEKKHRCRLCFRNFGNGRSLGGHLRSHVLKFCAEEKSSRKSLHSYSSTSLPSSSTSSEEEEREIAYGLRENPVCRRSKQVRKSRISDFDVFMVKKSKFEDEGMGDINEQSPPSSSISGTTSEEHVAQLLMMLSSGKWEKEEGESEEEEEEEEEELRGKYRCGACNKLFKSYQALGGHVASHKKTRASPPEKTAKIHRCPICGRIFSSGQALGGHKRSHFIGPNAIISRNSRIAQVLEIDLNLPAPIDDDESSQIVTSVFSTHVKQR